MERKTGIPAAKQDPRRPQNIKTTIDHRRFPKVSYPSISVACSDNIIEQLRAEFPESFPSWRLGGKPGQYYLKVFQPGISEAYSDNVLTLRFSKVFQPGMLEAYSDNMMGTRFAKVFQPSISEAYSGCTMTSNSQKFPNLVSVRYNLATAWP